MFHYNYEQANNHSVPPGREEALNVGVGAPGQQPLDTTAIDTPACWAFPFLDLHYRAPPCQLLEPGSGQRYPSSCSSSAPLLRKKTKRSASYSCLRAESRMPNMNFLPKQNRNLQLPSFESLGIAIPAHSHQFPPPSGGNEDLSSVSSSTPSPVSHQPFSRSHTSPLPITPPEYDEQVSWNPGAIQGSFPMMPLPERPLPSAGVNECSSQDATPSSGTHTVSYLTTPHDGTGKQSMSGSDSQPWQDKDRDAWLKDGYDAAVSSLAISTRPGESVQIVSQTLPCPASGAPTKTSPTASYIPVVQAFQNRLQPGQSPYISIIHAVPPKFNLSNLPTSPPSTPHLQFPGDDYFSCTVFSSAAPVPNYPYVDSLASPESAPVTAPTPIVPPYSVDVSVVERYLPPTTPQEYRDMFSAAGPSALVDRLLELSPNNGNLLLLYPTKQGAQTFERDYLSPILEPLLRHLVVMYRLPAEVGMTLGRLEAVPAMDDFDAMRCRVEQLCRDLNSRGKPATAQGGSRFDIVYSARGGVQVSRNLWTDWYIQQDTSRAKAVLTGFLRNHRPVSSDIVSTGIRDPPDAGSHVLRGFIEGIRQRAKEESTEPQSELELGVFVIRRSRNS